MQNKEYVKNEMHEQLVKSSSMSESNALFVNFVKQLLLVVPNNADEKLSKSAPLGKFINTVNYKNFVLKRYLTSQTLTEYGELHLFYKDQIAVELEIYLDMHEFFKFTIKETLCAAPNTKDEMNYYNWYPFKSKLVTFVDFNEQFFNILMKIDNSSITVLTRDESEPYSTMDIELLSTVMANFEKVSVPSNFTCHDKSITK